MKKLITSILFIYSLTLFSKESDSENSWDKFWCIYGAKEFRYYQIGLSLAQSPDHEGGSVGVISSLFYNYNFEEKKNAVSVSCNFFAVLLVGGAELSWRFDSEHQLVLMPKIGFGLGPIIYGAFVYPIPLTPSSKINSEFCFAINVPFNFFKKKT